MAAVFSPRMVLDPEESGASAPAGSTRLFYGFVALILFGPLAFGAVEDWAVLVMQCGAAALCIVLAVGAWRDGVAMRRNPLYLPMAVLAAIACVQLVFRTSAYPYASERTALQYAAYYLIFFLANQVLDSAERLKRFTAILTGFGFLLAVVSIVAGFASPTRLYGLRVTRNISDIYGPYVNHSHYAGLMEMLTPFPLIMTLRRSVPGEYKLPWAVAAFFMAASIFLSGSRGGQLAFGFEVAFILGLFLVRNRSRQARLSAAMVLCLLALVLLWSGNSRLAEQWGDLNRNEMAARVRLQIAHDTLHMAAARPMTGWGLGTFATAYPQFRTFYTNDLINAAHNDYLQFLSEMGIGGLAAILWFVVIVYRRGLRTIADPEADPAPYIRLAALVGVTGIVLHSFSDFNLQVPANVSIFLVLCSMVTNSESSGEEMRPTKRAYAVFAVVACALYLTLCARTYIGDRLADSWDENKLQAATRITPESAEPWLRLGHLNLDADRPAARLQLLKGVERNPYDPLGWIELALARETSGDAQSRQDALEHAVKCDPTTPAVLISAAGIYLGAGEENRGLQLLQSLGQHDRDRIPVVLDLAWRMTHDPAAILKQIADDDTDIKIALLNLMTQNDRPDAAAMVWESISRSPKPYEPRRVFPYVQYLTDHDQGKRAEEVWRRLGAVDKEFRAYVPRGNLIVNPGFELEMLNAGLDWRYQPVANVSMALDAALSHSGRYSLALNFDGDVEEAGISQSIPVRPNTDYALTGFYRVDHLEGTGGIQWEIRDTASKAVLNQGVLLNQLGEWQSFEDDFRTGESTELVRLRVVRVPAHDVLEGRIWIDDLELTERGAP